VGASILGTRGAATADDVLGDDLFKRTPATADMLSSIVAGHRVHLPLTAHL
jgi:hypothetical protein